MRRSLRMQRAAGPGEFEPGGTASRINAPLEELPATMRTVDQKQLIERGFDMSGNNLLGRTDYFTSVIGGGRPQPLVMPGNGRELLGQLRIKL